MAIKISNHSECRGFGEKIPPIPYSPSSRYAYIQNHFLVGIIEKVRQFFSRKQLDTNQMDQTIREQQMTNLRVGDWTENNSILITKSAQETNQWKLDLIRQAKQSIEISGSICGGQVFREALAAIRERIKEYPDLKVHILTTADLLEREDIQLLKEISKEFPQNFHYLKTRGHFDSQFYLAENHVKLLTVDEKYFITGGTNYQDRLSSESSKGAQPSKLLDHLLGCGASDMDVVGCGISTAQIARREFFKLFAILENKENRSGVLNHYYTPNQGEPCQIAQFDQHPELDRNVQVKLTVGSGDTPKNGCVQEFERLIRSCDKSMKIAQMYFHPQSEIAAALKEKTQNANGPKVTVITAGTPPGSPLANRFYAYANKVFAYVLAKGFPNIRVFEYDHGHNLIYHKKVTLFKRQQEKSEVVLGSFNWGGKSHRDYELMITIRSNDVGRKVSKILKQDREKSRQINMNSSLSCLTRIIGRIQSAFFPYLIG